MSDVKHKFFEIIKTDSDYEFVGRAKYAYGLSAVLIVGSILMLFINAFVIKSRGSMLNWGVDFRGGTELQVEFNKDVGIAEVRHAVEGGGFTGVDVVRYGAGGGSDTGKQFLVRMGAVSVISAEKAEAAKAKLGKVGDATLRSFEWSEGGDKIYLRFDKALEEASIKSALSGAGVEATGVQAFGREQDHTYEITLIGLDVEVTKAIEKSLGAGVVDKIPQVASVGAKAGRQLQIDGLKAVLGAMVLILLYVGLRFDFRYGPGAILALAHDSIITVGAFALTYREFSLTTLAAVLTIIGFSVNDTIVIFDRIRENIARFRDRKLERVINLSINETLSRTIWTSGTLMFVTLAMNIFASGVIRDFAFAMNVGVVVGTYSSVYVAAPIVIWLTNRAAAQGKSVRTNETARRRRDAEAV
jgi:preprotein translocase subunit SecF